MTLVTYVKITVVTLNVSVPFLNPFLFLIVKDLNFGTTKHE